MVENIFPKHWTLLTLKQKHLPIWGDAAMKRLEIQENKFLRAILGTPQDTHACLARLETGRVSLLNEDKLAPGYFFKYNL